MTTEQIANRLVELCRVGNYEQAQKELYHQNAISVEPEGIPNNRVEGMEAISRKGEEWAKNVVEVHGGSVSDPIISKDHFSVIMGYDATFKDRGRLKEDQVAVYKVEDGKITEERFFYSMG
ncbi:SnoaL-like domain-containing protein [Bernardetia sp.]|uniref:SnoaL-like domain-containing protein n=1 Tax=Bernardetia sp. TaxID=1937974 RepID=UPI0025C6195F|nr:SnoaL-like domain-containing protein [Bernardetia sp.]